MLPHCQNCAGGAGGAGAGGACPSADWAGEGAATNASCAAEAYTLAGFVSRKRPQPRLAASETTRINKEQLKAINSQAGMLYEQVQRRKQQQAMSQQR